jgi:hypothetical protein
MAMRPTPGVALLAVALASACGGSERKASAPCGPEKDVEHAGRTGVEGAKTGVTTGVEGVKTFGDATAGLFEGGSDEAKRRWREGKERTKETAHEGAASTRAAARSAPCK